MKLYLLFSLTLALPTTQIQPSKPGPHKQALTGTTIGTDPGYQPTPRTPSPFCSDDEKEYDEAGNQIYPAMSQKLKLKIDSRSKEELHTFLSKNPKKVEMTNHSDRDTLLMHLIATKQWGKVHTVLAFGPDVHRRGRFGTDALYKAAISEDPTSTGVMEELLKMGANPLSTQALDNTKMWVDDWTREVASLELKMNNLKHSLQTKKEKLGLLEAAAAQQEAKKIKAAAAQEKKE